MLFGMIARAARVPQTRDWVEVWVNRIGERCDGIIPKSMTSGITILTS